MIQSEINYTRELIFALLIWFSFTCVHQILDISEQVSVTNGLWLCGIYMLFLRNIGNFILLMNSCYCHYKPIETNANWDPGCLVNVEKAIMTELFLENFVIYLKKTNKKEMLPYIQAYVQIKEFEMKAAKEAENSRAIRESAQEIWANLRSEIQVEAENSNFIESRLQNPEEIIDKHFFDYIYGVTVNGLQLHYDSFKSSEEYAELVNQQERKTLIISRLKLANLI